MLRRDFLKSLGLTTTAVAVVGSSNLLAKEEAKVISKNAMSLDKAIKTITGGKKVSDSDKVNLTTPEIAENGAVVPVTVEVDSPMSESDYIKAIHVFAEKNANSRCADVMLTPANGIARFATRIKLGGTQKVIALVETSKGEFLKSQKSVKVTIGGCG